MDGSRGTVSIPGVSGFRPIDAAPGPSLCSCPVTELTVEALLDRVAELQERGDLAPVRDLAGESSDPLAREIRLILEDRQLRREHRARIYQDLVANRTELVRGEKPRIVHLIFWSEHVERLYSSLRRGRLGTFHFTRALEATCRRCGFDLLPAMGRLEDLGKAWSGRDYDAAYDFLSAHFVEIEAPRETPEQLGPQL